MKNNEIVWRTIADHAFQGRRRWESIADLAFESDVVEQTTHLAVKKLREVGAATKLGRGGLSITSPDKVVTILSAARSFRADLVAHTTHDALAQLNERNAPYALGLFDAAVHHLGGRNTVADYSQTTIYVGFDGWAGQPDFPPGDEVTILRADERAMRRWKGYASPAQTIADLFATPGWQAAEFRYAMHDRFVRTRDWEQL